MKILTDYNQIDAKLWDALVCTSPVGSWFQTREAYLFFDSLSFMEAFVVAVFEDNRLKGITVGYVQGDGGWLKRQLTRRAIIVGGPLLAENITDQQLSTMLNAVRSRLHKQAIYIETRNLNNFSRWRRTFEACGFQYVPHLNFHQDTSSIETVNKNLSRTRKRHIHVGLRDGATIEQATNPEEVESFYDILYDLYHNKVKKPLLPKEFFVKLAELPSARILTVKYDGKVIGGMAYVELAGRVGYEWYVCGMDDTYKNLYPSELATYAGLKYAASCGCTRFDFMGAGKPNVPYGVRDFKALFGGQLVEHGRFLHVCKPLFYNLGKAAISVIEKL
ncbi:MAG: lipid II:glycine glycyltransferase FemX [bacterium]